jgi:hypothetical protein
MLKILKVKVGLEHERMIFNRRTGRVANVRGKKQDILPHDTLSCLAETRGTPSFDAADAVLNFIREQARVDSLFNRRGYILKHGEFTLTEEEAKAAYEQDEDKKDELDPNFNLVRGGGLHLHFSLMDEYCTASELFCTPEFVKLCVAELDTVVGRWIEGKSNYRRPGKWELKPYGFEYRSLLWLGDPAVLLEITQKSLVTVTCCARSVTRMAEAVKKVASPDWASKDLFSDAVIA